MGVSSSKKNVDFKSPIKRHLEKLKPENIFKIVIYTMNETGFPKGLFTEEEQNINYFMTDINHQKEFMNKVIDITKIVTKEIFDINIENMLEGNEEQTNKFLQNFYKAANSKVDFKPLIDKYLIDKKTNKINNSNTKKKKILKLKLKTPIVPAQPSQPLDPSEPKFSDVNSFSNFSQNTAPYMQNGSIFWIDGKVNPENDESFKEFLKELDSYEFKYFNNLEEPFNLIMKNNFGLLFIIINGNLYQDYYYKLKENIKFIKCLPISIIFAPGDLKEKIFKREEDTSILNEEAFNSINNSFYNLGGVCYKIDYCKNFILNFYVCLQNKLEINEEKKIEETSFDRFIIFEYIYSQSQLVLPLLYNELMGKEKIPDNEIQLFINFILIKYREDKIRNLILPMLYIKEIPHEIVAKYFLKIYLGETSFGDEMNKLLMKLNSKDYQAFINIMFEGLLNKSISVAENEYLYRGAQMDKNKIENLIEKFEEWKVKDDKSLPSFLIYSRFFLSFSKDGKDISSLMGEPNKNFYNIVFILKNDSKITNKYTSNADIEIFSTFPKRKEVLFFPYSTFCLENIQKGEFNGKACVIINLEYLGKYSKVFDNIKNDENFENTFFDIYYNQNYSNEIISSKIMEPSISDINYAKKKIFERIKNEINEKFEIQIKDKTNEEIKSIEKMYPIEIEEK